MELISIRLSVSYLLIEIVSVIQLTNDADE